LTPFFALLAVHCLPYYAVQAGVLCDPAFKGIYSIIDHEL